MKPTSSYKMTNALKTHLMLAKFKSKELRSEWKKLLIQADLESQQKPVSKSKD